MEIWIKSCKETLGRTIEKCRQKSGTEIREKVVEIVRDIPELLEKSLKNLLEKNPGETSVKIPRNPLGETTREKL